MQNDDSHDVSTPEPSESPEQQPETTESTPEQQPEIITNIEYQESISIKDAPSESAVGVNPPDELPDPIDIED
jgi:hypothetical protein